MAGYLLTVAVALYLGLVTAISPCPLATNIAAVSYIGRSVGNARQVLIAGLLYALGRCLLYLLLAVLVTTTALSIRALSLFLQHTMYLLLGPVLLLLGLILTGLIQVTSGGIWVSSAMQKRIDAMGMWGAFLLGILFAMSFCPGPAVWFSGLLALVIGSEAGAIASVLERVGIEASEATVPGGLLVLPLVYGIGTALPVVVVAFLLAYSAKSIGKAYDALARVEWWARMIAGTLFMLIGIGLSLRYVFEV